ncbi:MAG: hypothetical protein IPI46_13885 [Bacteroidetes bacterium]|nr:hypothetical protein [Bacteroidota bacterium]
MKKCILALVLTLSVIKIFAQIDFKLPSPSVSAMNQYLDNTVNYATGVPQINIPLYEIKSGSLTFPISINYDAGGIRVNQVATEVGLGWSLNSCGIISRRIQGIEDNNSYSTRGGNLWQGELNSNYNTTSYEDLVDLAEAIGPGFDGVPDIYSFSANGHAVRFTKINGTIFTFPKKNYLIEESVNELGIVYPFVITIENGDRYYFLEFEETRTKSTSGGSSTVNFNKTSWFLSKIVNANLTDKIEFEYSNTLYQTDAGHSQTARFLAIDPNNPVIQDLWCGNIDNHYYNTIIHGKQVNKIVFKNGEVNFTDINGNNREDVVQSVPSLTMVIPKVNEIKVSNINGDLIKEINFNYSYFNSTNSSSTTYDNKRLRLDNIEINNTLGIINNNSALEKYQFTYNATKLPSLYSYAQDHWGFFNGATSNQSLLPHTSTQTGNPFANREVNELKVKAWVLEKIELPTGGFIEYEFESNRIFPTQSTITTYTTQNISQHFETIPNSCILTSPQSALSNTIISVPISCINGVGTTFQADLTPCGLSVDWPLTVSHGASCVKVFKYDIGSGTIIGTAIKVINLNNVNSLTQTKYFTLMPGDYILECSSKMGGFIINGNLSIQIPSTSQSPDDLVGGLRVKQVKKVDPFSPSNSIITNYAYNKPAPEIGSSGQIFSLPFYRELLTIYALDLAFMPNCQQITSTILCNASNTSVFVPTCILTSISNPYSNCSGWTPFMATTYSSNSFYSLNNGSHINYSFVTENFESISGNSNGKNLYQFTDFMSFPSNSILQFDPMWRRGLLLNKKVYNSTDDLVSEEINTYTQNVHTNGNSNGNHSYFTGIEAKYKGCTDCISTSMFSPTGYSVPTEYSFLQTEYRFPLEWISKESEEKKSYLSSGVISTQSDYFYDNASHMQPTRIKNFDSKGNEYCTYTKYASDYTIPFTSYFGSIKGLHNLQEKHIHTVPIETYTLKSESPSVSKVVSAKYSAFKDYTVPISGEHLTVLDKVYKLQTNNPFIGYQATSVASGFTMNFDSHLIKEFSLNIFDKNGNLLEGQTSSGKPVSYLWDYNYEFMTCKATNAKAIDIAYSSFETEFKGNWTYDLANVVDGTTLPTLKRIPTGNKCFKLTTLGGIINWSNSASVANTTARPFILSFWYSIDPSIASAHIEVMGQTILLSSTSNANVLISDYDIGASTHYKYCEIKLQLHGGNISDFEIKGNGAYIDELRLYPEESRMLTATYIPLVGLATKCDENNKINYFDFDETGRLKCVRDQFGDILSKNEYGINAID